MAYVATLDYVAPTTTAGKQAYASNMYNTSTGVITYPSTSFAASYTPGSGTQIAYITSWAVGCTCNTVCTLDGGCCPGPNVPITMADGTIKLAKDVKAGDEVLGWLEAENRIGAFKVTAAVRSLNFKSLVELDNGLKLEYSRNHRLHTGERWSRVDNLTSKSKLVGRMERVVVSIEDIGWGEVIKLTVEHAQTFDTCGIWNHNIKN